MTTIVYLAGRYRGLSKWRVIRWLEVFRNVCIAWWWTYRLNRAGYFVISPHCNSAFMGKAAPAKHWLNGDLRLIKALARMRDKLFVIGLIPKYETSKGTRAENRLADSLKVDIYTAQELLDLAKEKNGAIYTKE